MSFFAMPAWLRPPEATVPGIVPVELVLARTGTHAVLVTHLRAYPTGVDFVLTIRRHPGQPEPRRHDPGWRLHAQYRDLRFELRFADGHRVGNDPRYWPRTFETHQPDPPFLYFHGAGGSEERGWHSRHWLWGLPPPGPLAFVCAWPAGEVPASGVEIDAGLVLDAARRAEPVWPTG